MADWWDDMQAELQRVEERFNKKREIHDRGLSQEGIATIDKYQITARVGAGGRIQQLSLGPEALKLTPSLLSSEIIRCVHIAEAQYAKGIKEIALDVFGEGDEASHACSVIDSNFPPIEEEDAQVPESPRDSTHSWDDDDDDDGGWKGSILRS
ncbi:hypothetical protein [Segniliparus rugosus]|uniref:hypothetical protein n=1 Tax=Segniliparus rugosus TaxID=286804 RepID=UPI0012EC228F|nr:hypothetical protein [Segniliparus rugosus]